MTKTKLKKDALQDRLQAVLGPSWADLGPLRSQKSCSRLGRGSFFLKINVFEKVRCQEATWAELGLLRRPKGVQNGAQEGAKTEQKKEKKIEVKLREV